MERHCIRFFVMLMAVAGLFSSCGGKDDVDQAELAGNAAKQYYDYLLKGNYDAFVDGTYHADSLRAGYRLQLVENAQMFVAQQKNEHQGIKSVSLKHVDVDSLGTTANVFLVLHYGDKGTEQVLLPMVKHGDLWYMK